MSIKGFIFDIKRYSINDGPGIRSTVFLKGCPLNCLWCHNPESRRLKPEKVKSDSYTWSIYSQSCDPGIIGKEVTDLAVIEEVEKDIPFYQESGGGVTFSGGEPLLQEEFLFSMLSLCRQKGIHTVVDTSGYAPFSVIKKIYTVTDIFLYDMKIFNNELHEKYTGVSNNKILENLAGLTAMGNKVIVRIPVIPGVNDTDVNIQEIVDYLKPLNILGINLLPFHNSASSKYSRMNIENKFIGTKSLSGEEMESLRMKFALAGKLVSVGG